MILLHFQLMPHPEHSLLVDLLLDFRAEEGGFLDDVHLHLLELWGEVGEHSELLELLSLKGFEDSLLGEESIVELLDQVLASVLAVCFESDSGGGDLGYLIVSSGCYRLFFLLF